MTLSLHTNIASSKASISLAEHSSNLQKSLERLSTGQKINDSADDAGGLAVAMKLEGELSQLKNINQGMSNGLSLLQVQDSLLGETANILNKMIEIETLLTDGMLDADAITAYQGQFMDLTQQLVNIEKETFNDIDLFDATGGATAKTITISTSGDTISANNDANLAAALLQLTDNTTVAGTPAAHANYSTFEGFDTNANNTSALRLNTLKDALSNVADMRSTNGSLAQQIGFAQGVTSSKMVAYEEAVGRIMDVDIATESANLAKQQILVQASASMVAQANTANNAALLLLQ